MESHGEGEKHGQMSQSNGQHNPLPPLQYMQQPAQHGYNPYNLATSYPVYPGNHQQIQHEQARPQLHTFNNAYHNPYSQPPPQRPGYAPLFNHYQPQQAPRLSPTMQRTETQSPIIVPQMQRTPSQSTVKTEHVERVNTLPYDPRDMNWNNDRTLNDKHKYCYCGDDRNLLDVDVQCIKCFNYFHGRCIKLNLGPVVPFMSNYLFVCRNCAQNGTEVFSRTHCAWRVAAATTLANLALMRLRMQHPDWEKSAYAASNNAALAVDSGWFSRKTDMVPFLDVARHWAAICTDKDKAADPLWATKLGTSLIQASELFRAQDEAHRSANSNYALANNDLFAFRPGYGATARAGAPRKRKAGDLEPGRNSAPLSPVISKLKLESPAPKDEAVIIPPERTSQRERAPKDEVPVFTPRIPTKKEISKPPIVKDLARERKPTAKKAASSKKSDVPMKLIRRPPPYKPQDFNAIPKAPTMTPVEGTFCGEFFSISDIPYNKRGFKYSPCEAAPALPGIMYRQIEVGPHAPRIDWSDMSPYMYLSKDGLSATTDKGFRMGRANVGARVGDWYWEVEVLRGNGDQGGHVRLGIARREATVDGPIGFDGYSYGVRDRGGEKLHLSRPRPFMESFGTGDIIGFHLSLPQHARSSVTRDRIPIRYRQQLYFEQYEYTGSKEMEDLLNPVTTGVKSARMPQVLEGSFLSVYKNGKHMGNAFENLYSFWPPNSQTQRDQPAKDDGSLGYYPAVSVYSGGAVRLNMGPDFAFPLDAASLKVSSIAQRYDEQIAEDVVHDMIDELDFERDLQELSLGQEQLEVEPIREIAEYD